MLVLMYLHNHQVAFGLYIVELVEKIGISILILVVVYLLPYFVDYYSVNLKLFDSDLKSFDAHLLFYSSIFHIYQIFGHGYILIIHFQYDMYLTAFYIVVNL